MKTLWKSLKITLAFCVLFSVCYVFVLWIFARVAAPGKGEVEVVTLNGKVVGAARVGQQFTGAIYFWGRPSCAGDGYDASRSGGSNKATTNPEYLADVEQRVQDFLAAHPYLSRGEVPSEMVTASGSGLDPDISPRGAQVQVRRVAAARGLDEAVVQRLVDSLTQKPWLGLFGTAKVNVLRLNIALETLQPNVTASAGVRQAGGCGEGVSPEN